MRKTVLLALIAVVLANFGAAHSQVRVALKLDKTSQPLPGVVIPCDKDDRNCGLGATEQTKTSANENLVKISRAGKDFYVSFDTNQDGRLVDEKKMLLVNAGTVQLERKVKVGSKVFAQLPYEIEHFPPEPDDKGLDQFMLRPTYVASGTLSYKRCSSKIALLDMNFDGRFRMNDSDRGTNLRIDKNNDGRFWGKDEHRLSAEIIEFCGENLLVKSLTNRSIVLAPTDLRLAILDQRVPDFSFSLLNGQKVGAKDLDGRAYVLDFWASWCVPCVKNLPQLEAIRGTYDSVSVYAVNVDKARRKQVAYKITENAGMREFTTIRGLGNDDPLWKAFGGSNTNRLSIPLYVLIDEASVVRYAGNGGKDLVELKRAIEKVIAAR